MRHRPPAFVLAGLAAVLLVSVLPARGDTPSYFQQGQHEFSLQARYVGERQGKDRTLADVSVGYGWFFLDRAAFEVQLLGYRGHDAVDAYGGGASVAARYHLIATDRFSIYGEVTGGTLWTEEVFPEKGTKLNFTYSGGPGFTVRLFEQYHLMGGVVFQHLSNFFIEGRDRNPIFNSFGGYIGVMKTF